MFAQADDFLRSSHESWASGDPKALTTGITEYLASRDIKGPIPVGSEIDLCARGHAAYRAGQKWRAWSDSEAPRFPSNQFIEMLGNRDLAVSVINEMAGDEILIASRETLNKGETAGFFVSEQNADWLAYLSVAGSRPLLLLAIAIAVVSCAGGSSFEPAVGDHLHASCLSSCCRFTCGSAGAKAQRAAYRQAGEPARFLAVSMR